MSIETGLARAAAVAVERIAAEVPGDVRVRLDRGRIVLIGRALAVRSLLDPRLRDFAGLVR